MEKNGSCVDISVLITQLNDWTHLSWVRLLTFAAYFLLFVLGMVGNAGIIFGILRRGVEARIVPNVFLLNLAFIDILLCLVALPITPVTSIFKEWYFGGFLCKFVPMCQGMAVLVTSISLVFIAIDRYRNIVLVTGEPWKFQHAVGFVVAGWVFACLLNIPVFTSQVLSNLKNATPTVCGLFCMPHNWGGVTKQVYGSLMLFLQFILPFILLVFCYSKILWKVRQDMAVQAVAGANAQSLAAARKTRVMRILILMVGAFLLSWLPLSLLNILRDFDVKLGATLFEQLFFFSNLFHFCAMTSVVWNPVLYFWLSKYRRRDMARTLSGFPSTLHVPSSGKTGPRASGSPGRDPRLPLLPPRRIQSPTSRPPSPPTALEPRTYSASRLLYPLRDHRVHRPVPRAGSPSPSSSPSADTEPDVETA